MNYTVDTTENQPINLEPVTVEEEVIQNLWFLYSSLEYDVPLDLSDYERGILKPIVEVEINGEYENEEYTE